MKRILSVIVITIIGAVFIFFNSNKHADQKGDIAQTNDYEQIINAIVPSKYNYASFLGDNFILVSDSKLGGVIDLSKKIILPLKYKSVIYSKQHKIFMVAEENTKGELLWGIVSTDNKTIVPIIYNEIIHLSNSRSEPKAVVIKNSKYGFLDFVTGKVHIEPYYDFLGIDSCLIDENGEGFLFAKKEKKWAIINTNNDLLTPFDFDIFSNSSCNEIIAIKNDEKLKILLDLESISILSFEPYENKNPIEYVGIGVYISLFGTVEEVVPNGPAKLSGIKIYDKIVKINGIDTVMMSHEQMINNLRGEEDTVVVLDVLRDGELIQFKIKRAKITA